MKQAPAHTDKGFAGRLEMAIQRAKLQKSEVAKRLGLSRQRITNMLRGFGGGTHIPALAKILEVPSNWLATGKNPPAWIPADGYWKTMMDQFGVSRHDRMQIAAKLDAMLHQMMSVALKHGQAEGLNSKEMEKAFFWFIAMSGDYGKRYADGKVSGGVEGIDVRTGKKFIDTSHLEP